MKDWEIVVTMVLFACASIYLGTGRSLALFTLPGRRAWTVDRAVGRLVERVFPHDRRAGERGGGFLRRSRRRRAASP